MSTPAARHSVRLWLPAAIPAALVGHGAAYALAGRALVDSRHAWLVPALEYSALVLGILAAWLIVSALSRTATARDSERSFWHLWPRLALAQTLIFVCIERGEGASINLAAIAVQIAVACLAAAVIALFGRVLRSCAASAEKASRYLQRDLVKPLVYVSRSLGAPSFALAVCAGRARFQRPPPR